VASARAWVRSPRTVDHVGDGTAYGCAVEWSFDGAEPLGTGGAIVAALPLLGQSFLVSYGDSWLDTDYGAIVAAYRSQTRPALMTVYRNAGRWGRSNAAFVAGQLVRYDKGRDDPSMQYIDYGVSMLDRSVFERLARPWFDLADLYRDLVAAGRMAGMEVPNRFYEIGCPTGLAETEQILRGSASS
jgi:NDP-sugar pyrophosphorylase family protein